MHLMTHSSKKIQTLDEQIILLPSQRSWVGMLGTTLDYLAQIEPHTVTLEVFPRNESDGTRFSKFHCKRIPSNGAAGHPRPILLSCKNKIFCFYCKVFGSGYPLSQHSIPLLSAGTTLVQDRRQLGAVVPGPLMWNRCPPILHLAPVCYIHPILYF